MYENVSSFVIKNFITLGLARTSHGMLMIEALGRTGVRPLFGLIFAETETQLACSQPYWQHPAWWSLPESRAALRQLSGADISPVARVYDTYEIPYLFVPDLSRPTACQIIAAAKTDAILLVEAPVLRGDILHVAPRGIVNLHAAPLPEYRGSGATDWALYYDEPLSVSAHLVDAGIDTGPILARQPLPVKRGDCRSDICRRGEERCAQLAVTVMRAALADGISMTAQRRWQGRAFAGAVPVSIMNECDRRLRAGEYSHYA